MGRFLAITSALIGLVAAAWAAAVGPWAWWVLGAVVLAIVGVAASDLLQRKHSILRNYPVVGHLRFLLETLRPELAPVTSAVRLRILKSMSPSRPVQG
jgi:uncharacterized membrane protein